MHPNWSGCTHWLQVHLFKSIWDLGVSRDLDYARWDVWNELLKKSVDSVSFRRMKFVVLLSSVLRALASKAGLSADYVLDKCIHILFYKISGSSEKCSLLKYWNVFYGAADHKSSNCLKTGKGCSWHLDHRTAVLRLCLRGWLMSDYTWEMVCIIWKQEQRQEQRLVVWRGLLCCSWYRGQEG